MGLIEGALRCGGGGMGLARKQAIPDIDSLPIEKIRVWKQSPGS
ncbi:MAG: hypothetical protein Fur0037_03140 [Planctomycetota bacterium]